MKKSFLAAVAIFSALTASAQTEVARWIRQSSISPDGKTIAFAYQGDIFTVSADGGLAKQITSNPAYETNPIWTRDGKQIVFSSFREGSKDIYVIGTEGGVPQRLTKFNGNETPLAVKKDGTVLFRSAMQQVPGVDIFPGSEQVYSVKISGGNPSLFCAIPMQNLTINNQDVVLYEDNKGYEDNLRKHHTSSVTRDIWSYSSKKGSFTKLTAFEGEDRNPVFASDGKSFFYLSEQGGTFNVWRSSTTASADREQVTFLKKHPVRNLSISATNMLCFSYNGDLYTCVPGLDPRKVNISVIKDSNLREIVRRSVRSNIQDVSISPNGKEIALVANGDVYVTSVEFKTTRRITDTAEQERDVCFGADGRSIYYSSERDGNWGIFKTSLADKNDKYFTYSYNYEETRLTKKGQTCFQPSVSPDGKSIAYLRDRTDIVVKDITKDKASGKEECVLKGANYSYQDSDQYFEWSPDSKYILTGYQADGGWNNEDIALIDVNNGTVTNLTSSGYNDSHFHWAQGGKSMVWQSDRDGFRSHGSWGAQRDIYVMFFDAKAYRDFIQAEEEDQMDKLLAQKDTTEKDTKFRPDLDGIRDRRVRLTGVSGSLGDMYLSNDGTKLYYLRPTDEDRELRCYNIKKDETKVIKKGISGSFIVDKDEKNIYVVNSRSVSKISIGSGKTESVQFEGEYDYNAQAEREYIYNHVWKQVEEKFYDKNIHGIDWKALGKNYSAFLPYINNNFDFQDLLSELLGELNASHTGARYYFPNTLNTGRLGVLFDTQYSGKGLKIAEVLPKSVLAVQIPDLKDGDLILAIDGQPIAEGTNWYEALEGKAGKRLQLEVKCGAKTHKVFVKATSSDSEGLYLRWVRQREQMVEKLSGGKVGYVHVKGMNSESFREVYSTVLGKYRTCKAVIVDTRHNGGGWLHDDLASFLNGKAYIEFRPRGQYIGTEPYSKWNGVSCVLIGEDNYSDASGFPYVYKTLGIGKLIGAPVPGTMTAVWWERQVDPTLVFGIPQVTSWGLAEDRALENLQVEPDILIYNTPESMLQGRDLQLEAAVKEMLQQINDNGKKK